MFLAACLLYPLGAAAFIYLAHNLSFLKALTSAGREFSGGQREVFPVLLQFSGGDGVSADRLRGAEPGFSGRDEQRAAAVFCRPFTRTEYVLGR